MFQYGSPHNNLCRMDGHFQKPPKKEASASKASSSKKKSRDADEDGSSKKKKQKKKKDPNAPKRGMSSFMFFSNMEREVGLLSGLTLNLAKLTIRPRVPSL